MIINKKSTTDLSGFYIFYKGSVLNEDVSNWGISHLMEHLMCKGFEHLYDDFDRYGISWNAYTSNNEVCFYMTGLDEHVYKFRHEMLDSILKFNITEEEFNTERDVVIQEYKDAFQDQHGFVHDNILRKEYGCYSPIGKLESLQGLTLKSCKDYFKKHLSKPTTIINISKNNDFEGFKDFNTKSPTKFTPDKNDKLKIEKIIDFDKTFVYGYNKVEADFAKIKYVCAMIGGTMRSPLFTEIREKRGLTYSVSTYLYKVSNTEGFLFTGLNTTDAEHPTLKKNNIDITFEVYKDILTNRDKYLTEKQFNIIKDRQLVSKKKKKINRYANIDEYIEPKEWLVENIIEKFTFKEAQEIFDKYFKFDYFSWNTDKEQFKQGKI